jgi:uncharacterized protein (TIGR02996 family)
MWFATTDAEANFIFDLQADPDAAAPMLEYAQWLEERGDAARAEFLRLEFNPEVNENRLQTLRQQLDSRWLATVGSRRFRVGDDVRILRGPFQGVEGEVRAVDASQGRAGLRLRMFCRQTEPLWVAFGDLRVLARTPPRKQA